MSSDEQRNGDEVDWSLNDLRRYLYVTTTPEHFNHNRRTIQKMVEHLINENKVKEILSEVRDFNCKQTNESNLNLNYDLSAFILAHCVTARKNEQLTNEAYNTLKDISETPLSIFAFIYYHKCLLDEKSPKGGETAELTSKRSHGKGWGKGQRRVLNKWYNERNEEDTLRLVTKYRHLYSWTHKDLIKMGHLKAASEPLALIFRYLMFGLDKIKNTKPNEKEKVVFEFINDFESLKKCENSADAAKLIRTYKLHLDHLPIKLYRHKEVWEALVEDMNLQQFCNLIETFVSKQVLAPGSSTEKFVLDKLLSKEKVQLSKVHPIVPLIGLQIYKEAKLKNSNEGDVPQNDGAFTEALILAFYASLPFCQDKSSKRVACIVEKSAFMENSQVVGLKAITTLQTSACVMLTLRYLHQNCDFYLVNDKVNQLELPSRDLKPDLNHVVSSINQHASVEQCQIDKIFDWCSENKKAYDSFLFLVAESNINEKAFLTQLEASQASLSTPNSKALIFNLSQKPYASSCHSKSLLHIKGFSFDYFNILHAYLLNDLF